MLGSQTVSSLIQGISQQSESSRGSGSAKDQENCLNDVLDGAVARMGTSVLTSIDSNYSDPFVHEITRSDGERYIVIVESGTIRIFNKATGVESILTGSIASYLAHTGPARKAFQMVTVGDTTFLLNRQKVTAMAGTLSTARPNRAVAYVRAGGYKVTYTLRIEVGSNVYTASFQTVDNSSSGNSEFITTDYIAEQIEDELDSTTFPAMAGAGDTGFSVVRLGSTLIINRSNSGSYEVETSDGVGDSHFISFRDNVRKLTDLPTKCQSGYQVSVSDNGAQESSKFYLRYTGPSGTGRWEEVVAPSTPTTISASTMPQVLTNTGLDAFSVGAGTWGLRLAGDGILTAKDPSFIGKTINSMEFIGGRLAMVSEYSAILSRSRNAFVFFPDTVQTNLDTAPVDYDVSNGSSTAISFTTAASRKLQFWGDKQQTYLESGQDPIRENTTEVLPMANYEFDGEAAPKEIGLASVLFGTKVGRHAKMTEVFFRNGVPEGQIVTTAHVPKLMKGSIKHISPGEGMGAAFVLTSDEDDRAWLYQWFNQGTDRVQSAWNPWKFVAPSKVLWASIEGNVGWFLFKWPTGCTLEQVTMDRYGDEPVEYFPMRLDHRLSEADASYGAGTWTLNLPYQVPPEKRSQFRLVERTDVTDVSQRGRSKVFTWTDNDTITFSGAADLEFYFGCIPVARRKASRFLVRDQRTDEPVLHDKLLVKKVHVQHENTTEYDIEVTAFGGTPVVSTFYARQAGDPLLLNNQVPVRNGTHSASVGEATEDVEIELVNRTIFPSTWTGMKYDYDITLRVAAK